MGAGLVPLGGMVDGRGGVGTGDGESEDIKLFCTTLYMVTFFPPCYLHISVSLLPYPPSATILQTARSHPCSVFTNAWNEPITFTPSSIPSHTLNHVLVCVPRVSSFT